MTTNWMMILVKKVFTFFSPKSSVCHARLRAGLFIQETAYGGLSYKVKREFVASLQLKLFFKQQTIIEQILKIAQNYPTISKTASSDDPFFIKA